VLGLRNNEKITSHQPLATAASTVQGAAALKQRHLARIIFYFYNFIYKTHAAPQLTALALVATMKAENASFLLFQRKKV
jgi:hypothetical protein